MSSLNAAGPPSMLSRNTPGRFRFEAVSLNERPTRYGWRKPYCGFSRVDGSSRMTESSESGCLVLHPDEGIDDLSRDADTRVW